jgi:hypothetical protein
MPSECATLRRSLSNHPTRRTPWRKARCAATRKRRNRSRTRTSKKAPPPPRRSPACTVRRTRTRTATRSLKSARRAAANTLPCRGRVDARSASGWGLVRAALIGAVFGFALRLGGFIWLELSPWVTSWSGDSSWHGSAPTARQDAACAAARSEGRGRSLVNSLL